MRSRFAGWLEVANDAGAFVDKAHLFQRQRLHLADEARCREKSRAVHQSDAGGGVLLVGKQRGRAGTRLHRDIGT